MTPPCRPVNASGPLTYPSGGLRRTTGRGQDDVRWSPRLAEQLEYLSSSVGGSDYAPTASQREVAALRHQRTTAAKAEYDQVTAREVSAMNERLKGAGY